MANREYLGSGIQYSPELITHHDPLSAIAEAFKITRTNIEFSSINSNTRSLMITSSSQGEGKTSIFSNLAIAYAQMGRKVLLVDADLRRPSVHRYFGYINRRGLTNVLIGAGHYSEFILPTLTENLSILPAGPIPPNPADLLMSQTMTDLLEELEQVYDLVLIDTAPVGLVTDAAILSTKVGGTIFVVRSGVTNKKMLKRAVAMLEQVNARVLGYIMTGIDVESEDYTYYYMEYKSEQMNEIPNSRGNRAADRRRRKRPANVVISPEFKAAPLVRRSNMPPPINVTSESNSETLISEDD
ncbi:MAG: CpsD/CapB family tyrosine-protein kinase [Saccharofermentanales bacterium]